MPSSTLCLQSEQENLISEEVREIIDHRPNWMIRHGNLLFFIVLLIVLLLTTVIRYPDIIHGSARLVALNAPKLVSVRKEGKIHSILVANGEKVEKGKLLVYIESTADHKEVAQMYQWVLNAMQKVRNGQLDQLSSFAYPVYYNLGEIQSAYQNLEFEWKEYMEFFGRGYYKRKATDLMMDVVFANRLRQNIAYQETLAKQELQLQLTEYSAYDSLAQDRLVAPIALNTHKSKLISQEQILAQTAAQLINNDIAIHNKNKELQELQKQILDQQQKLFSTLMLLKSEAEKWLELYVITAPEDGQVYFLSALQANALVANGEELLYLQPQTTSYYAQLMAGHNGLGKIKEGQVVRLKMEGYPSEEFGYLKGEIATISPFPNRHDSFLIKVNLPQGLKTAYGKDLFFRNNMKASAEIITDERKLFDRIFETLKKAL